MLQTQGFSKLHNFSSWLKKSDYAYLFFDNTIGASYASTSYNC